MFISTEPFHVSQGFAKWEAGNVSEYKVEERTIDLVRDQLGNLSLDVRYTREKLCPMLKNSNSYKDS